MPGSEVASVLRDFVNLVTTNRPNVRRHVH